MPPQPPQVPPPQPPVPVSPLLQPQPPARPRSGRGWKVFFGIVLTLSILANVFLVMMLVGAAVFLVAGQGGILHEQVIRESSARAKIAVVSIEGIIYGRTAQDVYEQLKAAGDDRNVKAVIVRVNSPGGTVSGSDRIYNEIGKFRREKNIPVIGFMEGLAASGGYYTSVACEKIMAEPTTITGSIGVIAKYYVLEELLENKLGIAPVTVKSGKRKDWPSSTRKPDAEELKYIEEKMIKPVYERFISVVAQGRKKSLTEGQIRRLADGSIFVAAEAQEEKLIDDVGYLDDAIALVKSMAKITDAKVVEYRRPLSLVGLLGVHTSQPFKIDKNTLHELGTPEIMYLWSVH